MTPMSYLSDAAHAYRGYRCQALYALFRVFEAGSAAHLTFQLEGEEDLAISDTANNLIEVVQVKSYGSTLTLSDFKPDKKDSFFYRVAKLLKAHSGLSITIASFGPIGPELLRALSTDGPDRQRVAHKLSEHGYLPEADAQALLGNLQIRIVDEDALVQSVYSTLGNSLAGVDPEAAFDLLHYWLFICSERKTKLTQQDVIDRVNRVGKFTAERAAHHGQWFTTIVPIEDHALTDEARQELTDEFYLGIPTHYDHILADLDVVRAAKLEKMAEAFESARVVIVHGASGQGKTTLAFRYLREYFPSQWRFQVKLIENKQHALSIATALVGHADAIDIPVAVYLDVSASDRDWPDLVKQLAVHRNIRVLVTIREEDFNRASITGATLPFSAVNLTFEESEARELYQALGQRQVSAQFLSFDEAWRKFGGGGPLMEFVYLVTQGNSLYERLSEQVARLEDEVRTGTLRSNELALLRLVSVASAFDARLHVKPLVDHLGLPAPKRTFQYFEKEYLIRLSDDGSLVNGLHPIRSAILCDLLTDPTLTPWVESAQACLPFIHQPDVEVFLLHAFSRQQEDSTPLLQTLHTHQTDQWVAWAGITRALIWLGVREYVDTNRELIREAFADAGQGWDFHLDQDIADAMPGGSEELWHTLSSMASEEWRQRLEARHAQQTNKQQIFIRAQKWLASRTQKPAPPITDADWTAMAEALFWSGRLRIGWPLADWLSDVPFDAMIDTLPLQVLGDVMLGLSQGYPDLFGTWMTTHRHRLARRFRQETRTIVLGDDSEKITAHFVVEIEPSPTTWSVLNTRVKAAKNRFHEEAMVRIDLMRRLFPDRERYASQGYGHHLWSSDLDIDDTQKTGIARKHLPPLWLTAVNGTFRGLAEREFRPHTWPE
jgi:hypothetical protein